MKFDEWWDEQFNAEHPYSEEEVERMANLRNERDQLKRRLAQIEKELQDHEILARQLDAAGWAWSALKRSIHDDMDKWGKNGTAD